MQYLLVGNYGTGNLGDEALKEYFLKTFPEVKWVVTSARPNAQHSPRLRLASKCSEVPRFPLGLRSLFLTPWLRTWQALKNSDGMVFGGGSLFTDTESILACLLWSWHAFLAHCLRKPVFLAFQGVGPFRTWIGERLARKVTAWATFISVRDETSLHRLQAWGLNKNIVQSFDPLFSLIREDKREVSTKKLFIVMPRRNSSQAFLRRARSLAASFERVRVLSLEPDSHDERALCRRFQKTIGGSASVIPIRSLDHLAVEVAPASYVLAQRYHGALAAIALGIPVEIIPQRVGDKLTALQSLVREDRERSSTEAYLTELVKKGEQALREVL